jgi:hypothetical protein
MSHFTIYHRHMLMYNGKKCCLEINILILILFLSIRKKKRILMIYKKNTFMHHIQMEKFDHHHHHHFVIFVFVDYLHHHLLLVDQFEIVLHYQNFLMLMNLNLMMMFDNKIIHQFVLSFLLFLLLLHFVNRNMISKD